MKPYLLLILLLFSSPVFGQMREKCDLTLTSAPVLKDLRLGMSLKDVSLILGIPIQTVPDGVPVSLVKKDGKYEKLLPSNELYQQNRRKIEVGRTRFTYPDLKNKTKSQKLNDVIRLELSFYKEQLYIIDVLYFIKDADWKDIKDFTYRMSETLNLPKKSWLLAPFRGFLTCKEFEADTYFGDSQKSIFTVTNLLMKNEIYEKARQIYIEMETKKATKPLKKKASKP